MSGHIRHPFVQGARNVAVFLHVSGLQKLKQIRRRKGKQNLITPGSDHEVVRTIGTRGGGRSAQRVWHVVDEWRFPRPYIRFRVVGKPDRPEIELYAAHTCFRDHRICMRSLIRAAAIG